VARKYGRNDSCICAIKIREREKFVEPWWHWVLQ
jgi:hypothetical protein